MTFSQVKTKLTTAKAFPDGADDSTKSGILSEALERLINSGRWKGTQQRAAFKLQADGSLTLPRQYASIQGVRLDGRARQIASKWYEFLPGTTALTQYTQTFQDLGDGYATFADLPGNSYLKVTCADNDGNVTVFGLDENGDAIFQDTGDRGVSLSFDGANSSPHEFSKVLAVIKPTTTRTAQLIAVNPTTAVETVIGIYEPGETEPSYHRYQIRDAESWSAETLAAATVETLCELRFIEYSDNDVIFTSNLGALKNAVLGIHYENQAESGRSEFHFNRAYKLLNDELKRFRSDSEAGAIRIVAQGGFGASGMHRQPI